MRMSKVALWVVLLLWAVPSLAEDRTEVHLFQYGRTSSDLLSIAFVDFRDMLEEKLPRLSAEMMQTEATNPALSQLRLKSVTDENGVLLRPEARVGSLDDKRRYWRQTGALSVLTGHVKQQGGIPYVYTTFYWGDLRGPYPEEMVQLVLPVVGESFDNTSDSHSVAVLYAMAQEIKQDCKNTAEIIFLLSEAQKRARAISGDLPELSAELENMVIAAIENIRSECSGD